MSRSLKLKKATFKPTKRERVIPAATQAIPTIPMAVVKKQTSYFEISKWATLSGMYWNRLNTARNSHGSVAAQVVKLNKQHGIHVDLGSLVAPECTKVMDLHNQMFVLELEMDELMELITALGKCSSLLYEESAESDNVQELDDDGSLPDLG